MKDKLVDYWETENRLYDTYPNYCHYSTQLVFNKYFKNIKKKKILDIGCGHGAMMEFFKKKGAIVKGVDISPEAVSYSMSRGLDVIQADCRKLPLPDNGFIGNKTKLNRVFQSNDIFRARFIYFIYHCRQSC